MNVYDLLLGVRVEVLDFLSEWRGNSLRIVLKYPCALLARKLGTV